MIKVKIQVDLLPCYHCMYQCSKKQFFHFLEHFWNMNMVSRELNGFNLIGLQWLHHCLTNSSSHFSLFILENFRKWWKSCQFWAKTCCFCDFYEKHEKIWAWCITNYIISNLEWTYQGLSEINWYLGLYFYVFLTD